MKNIITVLAIAIGLLSCSKEKAKPILKNSNGLINQVLLVMDEGLWNDKEGAALKEFTDRDVLGLPQKEKQFKIIQIPTVSFKNLFRAQKNILIVKKDSVNTFDIQYDVFASPQVVITITGTTSEELIKQINTHGEEVIQTFKASDLKALQHRLHKERIDISKIKTFNENKFSFEITKGYKFVDDTGDFVWYRKRVTDEKTLNLMAYVSVLPEEVNDSTLIEYRNAIGKKYIPGEFEGTHYITEAAYEPDTFKTELAGLKGYVSYGKWTVKDDWIAGPFINYTLIDQKNNKLYFLEGFCYAPSASKRDLMFELEALLKTVRFE